MSTTPAGWHPDPQDPSKVRYWDGTQWTDNTAPGASAAPSAPSAPGYAPGAPAYTPAPGGTQGAGSGCLKWGLIAFAVVVVLGVVSVGCLVVVGGKAVDKIEKSFGVADKDDYDITIDSCTVGAGGLVEASGTLTNTASHKQAYLVEIAFSRSDGTVLSNGTDYIDTLAKKAKAQWSTTSTDTVVEGTNVTCKVNQVSYWPG